MGIFRKKGGSGGGQIVCPHCGTIYNREVLISVLKEQDPLLADAPKWTTRVICKICKNEFLVSNAG